MMVLWQTGRSGGLRCLVRACSGRTGPRDVPRGGIPTWRSRATRERWASGEQCILTIITIITLVDPSAGDAITLNSPACHQRYRMAPRRRCAALAEGRPVAAAEEAQAQAQAQAAA